MDKITLKNLKPMAMEDLKLRNYKNYRRKGIIQLWFVDGLGNGHLLITSEIYKFKLNNKFERYIKTNLGIKTINRIYRC